MIAIDAIKLLTVNGMSESCQTCQQEHRDCYYSQKYTLSDFCEWVENAMEESVDIVFCKECLYSKPYGNLLPSTLFCDIYKCLKNQNEYCSSAMRRPEDGEAN